MSILATRPDETCRTGADLKDIDVGSRFAPEFKDERVPTLGQVLDECKGKVGINIELKYYGHDEQLEQRAKLSVPERLLLELAGVLGVVPEIGKQ